ncbi:TonB-dependent receptor [Sphingomonas sp. ERG5]|uniref:TonB-dependent receptor n=1 Tax=Sphingomonas sp. ERG5 TaxID=1381597 RepID=UPI00054C7043|nr:TonB-dependent receptor [Sphingomonas sp. ERG5]
MTFFDKRTFWLSGAALMALASATPALAKDDIATTATTPDDGAPVAAPDAPTEAADDAIIVTARTTRSVTQVTNVEIQKILPGVSPLKAIQTLPGVTFLTADPWGNNEQNISLFIHGFNAQQLGYTLDGVPLGDQTYGNYNGLSPQRAIISENVGRVTLASGAGDLGTASTSNLGGTIDTFSSDPKSEMGATIAQTFGSYSTSRTFVRLDSGTFGNGNSLYVSGLRQDARAWDFNGKQGGYQANAKFVHDDSTGKLTLYAAYSDKTEPNEDATVITVANRATAPYARPFLYPDFKSALTYLSSGAYKAAGSNYRNYYSDAQRTDWLGYAKYDWNVSDKVTFSNQLYYHHDDGVGVVAGPIDVAGLPQLFSFYYPAVGSPTSPENLARLTQVFGGSGFATRTTEYRIDRGGLLSTLQVELGNHQIEIGGWYEHQSSSAKRRWYALDVNNPSTPYQRPRDTLVPLITQYWSEVRVDEIQTHIQDSWKPIPTLTIQAGFKSTFQRARQTMKVQPIPGSFTGSTALPNGEINTSTWFLPQLGVLWEATSHVQLFANAQKNIRQFQTSAASGLSPFALGSQKAFDIFRDTAKPETSWTYEAGVRTQQSFGGGISFDGQISYYHVDFSNRLLSVSPTPVITSIVSGSPLINNVGGVKTDGVDIAGTLRVGSHFSLYNALSYNVSKYQDDYVSGTATVPTAGKKVPGSPDWLYKVIASANYSIFDVQLVGDYIGKRYATYTNDLSVPSYFTLAGRVGAAIPLGDSAFVKELNISLNVTNITDKKAASTLSIGAASGTFNQFPLAPRQWFGTISAKF